MKDSRFSYLERPNLSPGACAVCKSHGPVIDYRINVPILGRLYICTACIEGGRSNIPLSDEQQEEVDKDQIISELQTLVEEYRGVVARINSLIAGWIAPPTDLVDLFDSTTTGEDEEAGLDNSKSPGKKSKSASKQDPDGIPSSTVNVDDLFG